MPTSPRDRTKKETPSRREPTRVLHSSGCDQADGEAEPPGRKAARLLGIGHSVREEIWTHVGDGRAVCVSTGGVMAASVLEENAADLERSNRALGFTPQEQIAGGLARLVAESFVVGDIGEKREGRA